MVRLRHRNGGVVNVPAEKAPRLLRSGFTTADEPASERHVCEVCGFEAKTSAGLGAHQRRHDEEG